MIAQTNIGTNDMVAAETFYNQLLAILDGRQVYRTERALVYAFGDHATRLTINSPYDGQPATSGNGCMVALAASSKEQVDALHARAMELGGTCEGAPGDRYEGALYAAYFRDLDGNKFGLLFMPNR